MLFIGVQSPLPPDECITLLTKPGALDMKLGSSSRVEDLYRHGQAGLMFAPSPLPPRALPQPQGRVYLQINRAANDAEWQQVQQTLELALRFNEDVIAGS